ncbi:patatin-like phospholipase family protein [Sporomusa malonica]|uniref:NTE family protein n=1 Tax=Sporomusa malonica TaxID=112901 RepID=A0A1W2C3U0_9FIRM|nr:patatin-like phospholipase family protein [Sporomusa malonica]SMC79776.1 NTE family protein [Sporomusa malonica]
MGETNTSACQQRPKIGVVLGGGGVKTLAAIALFEFLDEMGLEIDLLVGASGGAIMAALRGADVRTDNMPAIGRLLWQPKLYSRLDYRTMLDILELPFGRFDPGAAMLKPQALRQVLRNIFKDWQVENFHPVTLLQATDINTGKNVVLDNGLAADAVYAASAQFPFMPPAAIDGKLLVDGAYTAALPVLEAVKKNMDIIIAMTFENNPMSEPDSFLEYYWRFINKVLSTGERSQTALAIVLHHHEIILINVCCDEKPTLMEPDGLAAIVAAGRAAVNMNKQNILSVIETFSNNP